MFDSVAAATISERQLYMATLCNPMLTVCHATEYIPADYTLQVNCVVDCIVYNWCQKAFGRYGENRHVIEIVYRWCRGGWLV